MNTVITKIIQIKAITVFMIVFLLSGISPSFAASTGGCDDYTPASGVTVTCTSSTTPAATAGVISTQNSTTSGNNITVNIGSGTVLDFQGSTVGIGSGATVNNSGTLKTNSFYFGYGISSGANGRSQSGGSTINNYGVIITGGTSASGINISSTNSSSTSSTVNNTGSITTTGTGAHGIQITNGGALASVINSGSITVSGTNSVGINIVGAASITNSGTISSNGNAISFSGTIPSGLRNTLNINIGSSITGGIAFNTSGINETLTFNGYSGSLSNTITGLNIINATNSSTVVMNNASGLNLVNGQISVDATSALQIDSVISDQVTPSAVVSAITKTGAGTLTLTGANTYTGGTTVSAGTLKGNTSSLQGNILNNATVNFTQGTDGTYASVMSGTGTLVKEGSGVLTLSGANTYSGGTTVSAGTLKGNTTSLQGNILNNATVNFTQSVDGTYASVMSGTGAMVKESSGVLTLSGTNTYSGTTNINAGTLLLSGSIASNTTLASGATLQGGGTIFANLTNSGNIQPSVNNQLKNLSISGNYVGAGGGFITNIYAPINNPVADNLIVGGVISGTTLIVGVDRGGLGRPTTGDGILVVQGSGSANNFSLSGRIASGAYEYNLYRGNSSGTSTNNWYLRTDAPTLTSNAALPAIQITPDVRQRVEVAVYPAMPSLVQLYSQTVTDSLDQRRTDLSLNQQASQRDWIRMIGKTGSSTPSQVNDGPSLNFNAYAIQFGVDVYQDHQTDGSSTYIGPYATIGSANAKTSNSTGAVSTGSINGLTAYSFGLSATHFASNGLYLDALAQYSRYLRVQGASFQNAQLESQGTGLTGSIETGARWYLKENFFISPQMQVVYDSIGLENSADQYGQVLFNKSEISRGRVGLMFGQRNLSASVPLYAHLRASYWGVFNPGTSTTFQSLYGANPVTLDSQTGSKWLAVDGQINASITKLTDLFVNLGWENSLVGTYKAWNGRIGVQTRF
jgi:outer membrane autotransporter protein